VAYQIGSLSNTVIVDVTCADNDPTGFGGIGQRLPNTYHAYINGGGLGDGAYKIPPAQDWPNYDSGPNLGLTLSPTTYSDLNSAQQAAFSGVIAAADVIKAAPYEVASFIDLITQFNGNQITVAALIDQLKAFSRPAAQIYTDLSGELQQVFTALATSLNSGAFMAGQAIEGISEFCGGRSAADLLNHMGSVTYHEISSDLQQTFTLLGKTNTNQPQPVFSLIDQFRSSDMTVPDLNTKLSTVL
jgi:hypothetical protein